MRNTFYGYHPIVNFTWFALVLVFSMVFMHPCMLAISLVCALGYSGFLTEGKSLRRDLKYLVPLMVLTAVISPVFNHQGATILRWLPSGNPLTLESIVYGFAAAVMLVAVAEWFVCFNQVFTTDKLLYLFGRIIPALSLVLSMTLRFVPRFTGYMKSVAAAQKGLDGAREERGLMARARRGLTVLSITITWSLENAIETGDSMKSRGYGVGRRTAFSNFRFYSRDLYALLVTVACAAYVAVGSITEGIYWQYYPMIYGRIITPYALSVYLVYLALCALPLLLSFLEARRWKSTQSAI